MQRCLADLVLPLAPKEGELYPTSKKEKRLAGKIVDSWQAKVE